MSKEDGVAHTNSLARGREQRVKAHTATSKYGGNHSLRQSKEHDENEGHS